MSRSTSVLRRYTPPTCTLEIMAKRSPLSRWTGQPVLKNVRFHLRFETSPLAGDQPVELWGDRTQLETLCEVVETYVQQLLDRSTLPFDPVSVQFPEPSRDTAAANTADTPASNPDFAGSEAADPAPDRIALDTGKDETQSESDTLPPAAASATANPLESSDDDSSGKSHQSGTLLGLTPAEKKSASLSSTLYLQPRGRLSHTLFLGSLASQESRATIGLSTLQLFDLATALEQYAMEVMTLPELQRPRWIKRPPAWMGTAAAVLLAVGLTTATLKFIDMPQPLLQSSDSLEEKAQSEAEDPLAVQPATESLPPLPPLDSKETLPPPPSLPSPSPVSGADLPTFSIPKTPPTKPDYQPVPNKDLYKLPPIGSTKPSARPNEAKEERQTIGSRRDSLTESLPQRVPNRAADGYLQRPQQETASPDKESDDRSLASQSASGNSVENSQLNQSERFRNEGPDAQFGDNAPFDSDIAPAAPSAPAAVPPPPAATRSSSQLFDTIPQVAEARTYFQQRWKPVASLNQTLEYRLILNANGSIQRIVPLGQVAQTYLDRTGIPLLGEPFVSPVDEGNVTIRLVLGPDGTVQTFRE